MPQLTTSATVPLRRGLRAASASIRSLARGVAPGVALAAALAAAPAVSAQVIREGTGERRDRLNAMELKPFDAGLWSNLSSWSNGPALDAAATDGKVVVIYTFSSFLPQSIRPLVVLDRLQKRHADEGLVVVGVHHPEGWDGAARQVERRRADITYAHDAEGAFRAALSVDQDPDLYIIDRAGQLRYADIETGSVDEAVRELLAESSGSAASFLDRRRADRERADRDARRSAQLRSQINLATLPEIPFIAPTPEQYQSVDWPTFYEYQGLDERGNRRDREEDSPRMIELPAEGKYVPALPANRDGRITLIYFWTPEEGMASWNTFYDTMQTIQREHPRDVVVLGVAIPFNDGSRRLRGDEAEERERELERARERFDEFFDRKPLNHAILNQIDDGNLYETVITGEGRRSRSRDRWLPYLALMSSDGNLRWHGINGVDNEEFRDAFRRLLEDDPGVIARRQAEEAFISAQVERASRTSD